MREWLRAIPRRRRRNQCKALSIMAAFLELAAVAARTEIYARGTGHESGRVSRTSSQRRPRSSRSVGQEFQGNAVDAVAQSGGRRAVLEDMAQMSAAATAMHLGAWQQQQVVGGGADGVRQRPVEARPAGLAVVFGLRGEHRKIATRAGKRALALLVVERARARGFGAVPPQHVVLRLGE